MHNLAWAVVVVLIGGCARSDTPSEADTERKIAAQTLRAMFYTLDCTDEGHLEAGEIGEHMSQLFRPYDVDRSITLSAKEFERAGRLSDPELLGTAFSMSDADASGEVTGREFEAYIARLLDVMDTDRDGEITPEELGDETLNPRRFR